MAIIERSRSPVSLKLGGLGTGGRSQLDKLAWVFIIAEVGGGGVPPRGETAITSDRERRAPELGRGAGGKLFPAGGGGKGGKPEALARDGGVTIVGRGGGGNCPNGGAEVVEGDTERGTGGRERVLPGRLGRGESGGRGCWIEGGAHVVAGVVVGRVGFTEGTGNGGSMALLETTGRGLGARLDKERRATGNGGKVVRLVAGADRSDSAVKVNSLRGWEESAVSMAEFLGAEFLGVVRVLATRFGGDDGALRAARSPVR